MGDSYRKQLAKASDLRLAICRSTHKLHDGGANESLFMTHTPTGIRAILDDVDTLSRLNPEEQAARFLALPDERAILVFQLLSAGHQQELIDRLDSERVTSLVEALDPDDRVQLIEQLPSAISRGLRDLLSPGEQQLTDLLLQYAPESAGRIMTPEFVSLSNHMTAREALELARTRGRDAETILALPVTDDSGFLLGLAALDDLVLSPPETPVNEIMDPSPPRVRVDEDQEAAARLIQAANMVALPVVDERDHLLGLITVDDAMDVMEFEEAEDLARTGAAEPIDRPYFSVSVLRLLRSRVVWLLLLSVAAILTVNVLNAFEGTLDQVISLSLFIPLLIGVGGNTGAQSATTIVRAMAVDEVQVRDVARVLLRESRVGLLLGITLAVLGFVPVWLYFTRDLALVIALALVAICCLAALVGSLMPILAKRVGVDPAVVSAPFVTTIVDTTGLLVYFLIARAILGI